MMDIKVLKEFTTTTYGNLSEGDVLKNIPDGLANQWIEHGMVESMATYQTKVIRETPKVAGEVKKSSSSQAAPASQKKTRKPAKKKKGKVKQK